MPAAGWTINLYADDGTTAGALDATDTWLDDDVTDVNGDYSFLNLIPGTYIVCEESMTGWIQTFPNAVAGEVIDTCDEVAGQEAFGYLFTASSGQDEIGNDFGNFELIDKTGTKYEDLNGDGDLTDGVAIEGWTIYLYDDVGSVPGDLDATDTLNTSTTTDASGNYTFGDLGPGDYIVCEDLPTGWMQTFPSAAGGEVIDTCDEGGHAEFGYAFSASSGDDETLNDFANFELIDKTGTKYIDAGGDGSIAGDSPYLGGWTINLYKDDGNDILELTDFVTSTTTSAVDGSYTFPGLAAGTYWVCEAAAPSGWFQSFPNTVAGEVVDTATTWETRSSATRSPPDPVRTRPATTSATSSKARSPARSSTTRTTTTSGRLASLASRAGRSTCSAPTAWATPFT